MLRERQIQPARSSPYSRSASRDGAIWLPPPSPMNSLASSVVRAGDVAKRYNRQNNAIKTGSSFFRSRSSPRSACSECNPTVVQLHIIKAQLTMIELRCEMSSLTKDRCRWSGGYVMAHQCGLARQREFLQACNCACVVAVACLVTIKPRQSVHLCAAIFLFGNRVLSPIKHRLLDYHIVVLRTWLVDCRAWSTSMLVYYRGSNGIFSPESSHSFAT